MGEVIRVVIVDDDPMVRTGLGLILGGSADIEVVAEAIDGEEALDVVAEHRPDIVLMDIRMPRLDGLAATRALMERADPPKVIVLTTFDSDDMVLQALQAGAAGFLLKDTPPPAMVSAVRRAHGGEPTLSPSVTAQVIAAATKGVGVERRQEALADMDLLNERERDVALAIGAGRSNAEIASELFMSVATVKAHVTRILDKWGCENRVQVAVRVHDAGLA